MTTTVATHALEFGATLSDARAFAEIVTIVTLAALLLQRETLRGLPAVWARSGAAGITAVALPLILAWGLITVRRFLDLLS